MAFRRGVCRAHPLCCFVKKTGRECEKRRLGDSMYCDVHSRPVVAPVMNRGAKCSGTNAKGKKCGAKPNLERRGKYYCSVHVGQGGEEEIVKEEEESSEEDEAMGLQEDQNKRAFLLPVIEFDGKGWRRVECGGWVSKDERCGAVLVLSGSAERAGWLCVLHEKRCKDSDERHKEKGGEDRAEKCSGVNAKGKACGTRASVERNGEWYCTEHVKQGDEEKEEQAALKVEGENSKEVTLNTCDQKKALDGRKGCVFFQIVFIKVFIDSFLERKCLKFIIKTIKSLKYF